MSLGAQSNSNALEQYLVVSVRKRGKDAGVSQVASKDSGGASFAQSSHSCESELGGLQRGDTRYLVATEGCTRYEVQLKVPAGGDEGNAGG